MKKIVLMFIIIIMCTIRANAQEYTDYCAQEPYEVGNSFTQFVSNITGANFIESKAYESALQKVLKKELSSDFNVEVYPFGAKSLSEGKFQKIAITSKHITSPYLYMTDFKLESLCPYNRAYVKEDKFYFNENFVGKFEGTITDYDMKKMLEDKVNKASKLNLKIGSINLFKIVNPEVSIKNKRMNIEMELQYSNFITSKKTQLHIDTALAVSNGEITFSDTKFGNSIINTQTISPVMNMINPFSKRIQIDNYNDVELRIKKLDFEDNEIKIEGIVFIPYYSKLQ